MARKIYTHNIFRGQRNQSFGQSSQIGTTYQETVQFEEAVVLDVIVNDSHPSYNAAGDNVGVIKFRFINSQQYLSEESLNEAFPFFANISDYPLLNEIVYVFRALNRWYYMAKFNTTNKVTAQALFGLNAGLESVPTSGQDSKQKTEIADGGSEIKQDRTAREERLGETFVDKEGVYRLRHQEGDLIIEGRSGHSIRFGSDQETEQSPNMLIRIGPNPDPERSIDDSEFALVNEDVDKDLSSIWIVSNQTIPLTFATVGSDTHFESMTEKPGTLDGNQIVINSDRLVFNTKGDKFLASSFLGTHFTTLQDHTVDADKNYKSYAGLNREVRIGQDYLITIGRDYLLEVARDKTSKIAGATIHQSEGNHSIVANKIFIGSLKDETEPLVLGEQLRDFINQFLNIFVRNAATLTLPTIGVGPLNPAVVAQIAALQTQFGITAKGSAQTQGFLSQNNFVTRE